MKKLASILSVATALTMGSSPTPETSKSVGGFYQSHKSPLTPKQSKARRKSKLAKKARRINRN